MEFNDRILQARKIRGLSQENLAELIGVSRQAVSKWETGEAMPDLEKLITLCRVLELDMEYLALGKQPVAPAPAPHKPRWWIAAVLAAGCLVLGILIGAHLTTLPDTESALLLDLVSVADVLVEQISDEQTLELRILTDSLPEGMTAELIYERQNSDTAPDRKQCGFDGTYYYTTLQRPEDEAHYHITLILTLGSHTKQLPLITLDCWVDGLWYTHLWE